ncbi:hypothetical protein CEXT_214371 [Caerostris extrusa]|uniref:Uncharacterized protein n=1 Tax=Caerostris extrusa TaxID=172846 RepID=A0AAV4NDR1_CAEEX|nr:hypothetical protein CEXT_214371 [Caerostris extrusa]
MQNAQRFKKVNRFPVGTLGVFIKEILSVTENIDTGKRLNRYPRLLKFAFYYPVGFTEFSEVSFGKREKKIVNILQVFFVSVYLDKRPGVRMSSSSNHPAHFLKIKQRKLCIVMSVDRWRPTQRVRDVAV